jgi:erythromycin esterase-like protein
MVLHEIRRGSTALAVALVLAAPSLSVAGCRSAGQTLRNPAEAATAVTAEAWIAAARYPLEFDVDAPVIPAALVDACSGARVVGLGEFSHGTHEDAIFKSALALAPIDAGEVDTLYIEANRTGGEQLDAFIRSDGGDAREALAKTDVFLVLKSEGFAHLVAGMQRRVAAGKKLRIVGIDCQDSRRDAEFALERLAGHDAKSAEVFRARLRPIVGSEAGRLRHPQLMQAPDTAGVNACIAALEELERALAGDAAGAAVAARARQGLLSYQFDVSDADPSKAGGDYFSRRDRYMAENILADGARKGALWGHDIHIFGGPRDAVEGFVPSGTVLREALGAAYRIVVCDYRRARISLVVLQPGREYPNALAPKEVVERDRLPGGLGDAIAGDAEGSFWIDLSTMGPGSSFDLWRATPRPLDWPGFAASRERRAEEMMSAPVGQLVDIVVVFEEAGPVRWIETAASRAS